MRLIRATAVIGLSVTLASPALLNAPPATADDALIAIAEVKRDAPVDFAVTPKNGAESLLLARATGQDGLMPPPDNKVAAKPFTPEELGLIKLWLDQGAAGIVTGYTGYRQLA
jgi:hypothetical protein